ncbi:MAG: NAD(P)-dependent alcohol dehydrogenase [Pedobacter sp.]|nr:MAG: NAD(P)-dependent alcohol dehydrogenase [Pedobacter sp.]
MKAAIRYKYCNPGDLVVTGIPMPVIGREEVLIKVKATTVNRTDCGVLTGKPWLIRCFIGLTKPGRPITGTDFAGIVVARGSDVTHLEVSDDVFGFFDQGLSSHAEYVAIHEKRAVFKKPEHITYEQAAASLEGAHYAFYFLNKLDLKPGVKVLVNGGTGAIGNAALQFLKHFGAEVTVTCETDYVGVLELQGADKVIDYTKQDFTKLNEQFDYVFDAVGKSTFAKCKPLLKLKGIYISSELGPYWQNPLLALVTPLMPGKGVRFPLPFSAHRSIKFINELLVARKFNPLIDRRYKLDEISKAYQYVLSGQKKGNVILTFD